MQEQNGKVRERLHAILCKLFGTFTEESLDVFDKISREEKLNFLLQNSISGLNPRLSRLESENILVQIVNLLKVSKDEFQAFIRWDDESDHTGLDGMFVNIPGFQENFTAYRSIPGYRILKEKLLKTYSMNSEMKYDYSALVEVLSQQYRAINAPDNERCERFKDCLCLKKHWSFECFCDPCNMFRSQFFGGIITTKLEKLKLPITWVGEDLCRDMLEAKPDSSVLFTDLNFPDDAGVYMIPPGILGKYSIDKIELDPIGITWALNMDVLMVGCVGTNTDRNNPLHTMLTIGLKMKCKVEDALAELETKRDKIDWVAVVTLLLNLVAIQTALPELYVPAGVRFPEQPESNKRRSVRVGVWHPTRLGEKYKTPAKPGDGSHASPRLHRVSGHFTNQPHGEGRLLRKLIWIKPHWRGKGE